MEDFEVPKAGDQIVVSETQSITFLQTAEDTNGELLEVRATYKPESPSPPAHYHPQQYERFEVLRGTFCAVIDGKETIHRPGDTFMVPAGAIHWMHNIASERGELLWQIRPALRTEYFFTSFWTLDQESAGSDRSPNLLQIAVLLPEFYDEFRLASPPFIIQKLLFGVLSVLGRALGYRKSDVFGVSRR
jgi:quercetin dioxygenase-like cupin family protein